MGAILGKSVGISPASPAFGLSFLPSMEGAVHTPVAKGARKVTGALGAFEAIGAGLWCGVRSALSRRSIFEDGTPGNDYPGQMWM
jgi:hypothetical protein